MSWPTAAANRALKTLTYTDHTLQPCHQPGRRRVQLCKTQALEWNLS